MYNHSIFIFRRDLRLYDNTGLIKALTSSRTVILIFILTPEQLLDNPYKSDNCVQFMMESLDDLDSQLCEHKSRLYLFFGKPSQVIEDLITNMPIDAVFVNMDYTPYSTKRDNEIEKKCLDKNIKFHSYEDITLNPIGSIKTTNDKAYTKFTPFFNKASETKIPLPAKNDHTNYIKHNIKIKNEFKKDKHNLYVYNENIAQNGGRTFGLEILKNIGDFKNYNKDRNILNINTTRLSAYNKFGCVSIREVYHSVKKNIGLKSEIIRQLYWRDFYYNLLFFYPKTLSKHEPINLKYNNIQWNDNKLLKKWQLGQTGFPVVDACMRELNTTGYMHNRGRLIVSSFLIKTLHINWTHGEAYFSKNLIDYDPAQNVGNWQWVFYTIDGSGYTRIFNPWRQSIKFDKDCQYIKKWVPELKDVNNSDIHKWNEKYVNYKINYPKPIVDYEKEKNKTLKIYGKIRKSKKKD